MIEATRDRRLSAAMRTTALASIGDVLIDGVTEFEDTFDAPSVELLHEIATACREAVRVMAREPENVQAVHASLTQTVEELRGANTMIATGAIAPELIDSVARATLGKLFDAFGGDHGALERLPPGRLGMPGDALPDINDAEAPPLSKARDEYLMSKGGDDPAEWSKDTKRAKAQIDAFIDYAGDRPLTGYGIADIEDYAKDLECLPLRAETLKDENGRFILKGMPIREQIAYGREHPERQRITQGTIANGYVAIVRSAVTWQCRRNKPRLPDPFDGALIKKPSKATKRRYRPLPIKVVNRAIELAVDDSSLLAPLFVLALLGTRRLGVLTYINGHWLEKRGRHWVCRPTPTVELNGRTVEIPEKTEESLKPFVLHDALVKAGIVDAMNEGKFLFAPLLTPKDPAAALSKRANRLLQKAGAGGRDEGEVFHSFRAGGIVHYRRHVPDAARLQAGHAATDDHQSYDYDDVTGGDDPCDIDEDDVGVDFGTLDAETLVARVAKAPLPPGLDLRPCATFDMGKALARGNLNSQTQERRQRSRRARKPNG